MTSTMSYYRRYLELLKKLYGSDFQMEKTELDERADAAEIEYEIARRNGMSVDLAHEQAMTVLLDGIVIEKEEDGIQ